MERREFNKGLLGSILGLVAGQPFIAEAIEAGHLAPPKTIDDFETFKQWKVAAWTPEKLLIRTPGLQSVSLCLSSVVFEAEPIDLQREFTVMGSCLLNSRGEMIGSRRHDMTHTLLSGDRLYLTFTLLWPMWMTGKEVGDFCERHNLGRYAGETYPPIISYENGRSS
jgi:hypothetical protein